ncbi:MAG: hypothetical protein R6W06_03340 [Prochlorococcaceae cyanobacterium]
MISARDPSQLQGLEPLWLGLLIAALLFYPLLALQHRGSRRWLEPPVTLGVVFAYYTVFGPLKALQEGGWIDRSANLRHGFEIAWLGALVAFGSFLVGYALIPQKLGVPRRISGLDPARSWLYGQRVNQVALGAFALVTGPKLLAMLNPIAVADSNLGSGLDLGAFENYATLAVNLLVPGCLLMLAALMRGRGSPLTLAGWVFVAVAIYTSLGFRYRLVLLLAPMALLWLLTTRRRPNIPLMVALILLLILGSGAFAYTRTYGGGLNLESLEGKSLIDIFLYGFQDSVIFVTSGGVMAATPDHHPFFGLEPFIQTLLFPIPKLLMPDKDSAGYLYQALEAIYPSRIYAAGAAYLNFAEYYMIAGWWSLIAIYGILGVAYRRLWLWLQPRQSEPLALVAYVVSVCYLFMVVSRGYLPQVAMLFAFSAAPLFIIYRLTSRPAPISANLARSIEKATPFMREKLRLRQRKPLHTR